MDCPVCKKQLIVIERSKIELDYCIFCKGFWFDQGEIELLIETLKLSFNFSDILQYPAENNIEKKFNCPRCSSKMDKIYFGYTLLDRCVNGHGLWFDPGELGKLLSQYAHSEESEEMPVMRFLGEIFNTDNTETQV